MNDLEYLIKYETENTFLDFKATQYQKTQFEAFLKDIIAMANAFGTDDKHIILGLKLKNHGEREFLGIKKGEFVDAATYQQLIYENIEPAVNFDYSPLEFDDKIFGIITLSECTDKPYMMKKDYKNLRKGDSYMRRGDSQDKLTRRDIDKIIEEKNGNYDFSDKIRIGFDCEGTPDSIELTHIENIDLPSRKAEQEIKKILHKKKKKLVDKEKKQRQRAIDLNLPKETLLAIEKLESIKFPTLNISRLPFGKRSYEDFTINELEEALKNVEEKYQDEDLFTIFELNAHKLNLKILNESDRYIEDASLELIFPKFEGLHVNERVYEKPNKNRFISQEIYLSGYPEVTTNETDIVVKEELGNIKHHIPEIAFSEPLRIIFANNLLDSTIECEAKLYAKNLNTPYQKSLNIEIVKP